MAVALACAVPRHSPRSPGFRIHAGPALCGDRRLVARARACCSKSIGETAPWTCVVGFLKSHPEMPAASVTSATAPGIRMVRSATDLRGNSQWPSSVPIPWASAEASPVSTAPRDPATSGTARTAKPTLPWQSWLRHVPSEDEAWNSCSTATPGMGWHQSNLGLAAGLHRWGKAAATRPNQLPAVQSATWQTERPATHSTPKAGEGVPPVCSSLQVRQGQAQKHGLGWRAGQWGGRAQATYRQWAR